MKKNVFSSIIVLLFVWYTEMSMQNCEILLGLVPNEILVQPSSNEHWANTNKLSELNGIKAEFEMRTTVYHINICSPVHSLGISFSFHLSLFFKCAFFSVVWPHNKQISTWQEFIVQRASFFQTCFFIDQNWF